MTNINEQNEDYKVPIEKDEFNNIINNLTEERNNLKMETKIDISKLNNITDINQFNLDFNSLFINEKKKNNNENINNNENMNIIEVAPAQLNGGGWLTVENESTFSNFGFKHSSGNDLGYCDLKLAYDDNQYLINNENLNREYTTLEELQRIRNQEIYDY